ncbi:MAG: endonuclease MutS2 [Candidatus Eisenbacteria sp.]|nr:endonuclease MutS2 [Candidatus Eisenbacteria bacterium]
MVDAHTLQVLEFRKILDLLVSRARTRVGKERAAELDPIDDIQILRNRLEIVSAFREILSSDGAISLEGIHDIRAQLSAAEVEGNLLDPGDLLQVMETARVMAQLASSLARYHDRLPLAAGEAGGIIPTPALVETIGRSIEDSGRVSDRATPRLVEIRRRRNRVRGQLRQHLEKYLGSSVLEDARQEDLITIRNGRFVIPVKAERRRRVPGIVHDRSASGATVFVEPLDTVDLNNELHELDGEERTEIRRVLQNLTSMVSEAAPALRRNLDITGAVDLDFAMARLSIDLGAEPPELNRDGQIHIVQGRHPLLEGMATGGDGAAVPLEMELGPRKRVLVVTGPNMGGKTVALKTVGLLTLMAQSGLHVPSGAGTRLAIFEKIYADIGDEQSIEQSLSTFSSHLKHLVRVLDNADNRTLVLLDELGAGTDPEEGVALGISVIETLADRDARVVATTHHGAFKVLAENHKWFENASLEFDPETLRPTYRFRMGIPGPSRGLDLAAGEGVPPAVLERARALMGSERLQLEAMLMDLETRLADIDRERTAIAGEREVLEERNQILAKRLRGVRREEKELREKALSEASRVVEDARKLVERTVAEVRAKGADRPAIKKARADLDQAAKKLEAGRESSPPAHLPAARVGDEVWISTLDKRGVVVAEPDSGGRVTIQSGKLRLKVPLESLGTPPDGSGSQETAGKVRWDGEVSAATEIDVRGLPADEAIQWIDRFLDEAMLAGLNEVRVIHGKGKGILKREVEAALARDQRVRGFRLGNWNEGGWGATVVVLK